jgi:hypothetical protein
MENALMKITSYLPSATVDGDTDVETSNDFELEL